MPSLADIPQELILRPSRVLFLQWLASLQISDVHITNSLISKYSKATGLGFTSLDTTFLANQISNLKQTRFSQ